MIKRIVLPLLALVCSFVLPPSSFLSAAEPRELTRLIDGAIQTKLDAVKVQPAPRADDAEFLRRVYLDLTGSIPPFEKVAPFLDDQDADKRSKLIDELLAGRPYAQHMTQLWRQRLVPDEAVSGFGNRSYMKPLDQWLEESFHTNKPWDRFVTEILTLEGKDAPVRGFYTFDTQFATVEQFTNKVGQYFLGVQLGCAQCHDHPYKKGLGKNDYWGLAAFFGKLTPTFAEDPKQQEPKNKPDGYKTMPARFLGGEQPKLDGQDRRRPELARWLTSAENPYFAKAMVNRTWAHFFGRGLINPVDDLGFGNVASHPAVLDELSRQFAAHAFDVKYLVRAVCNTEAYQRSSRRPVDDRSGPELYGFAPVRGLTPRQLGNARALIARGAGFKEKDFLAVFDLTADDAAVYPHGILETLKLMNSASVNDSGAALAKLVKPDGPAEANVEALYLCVLSRRPSAVELQRATAHVGKKESQSAYADLFWALLNCAEFHVNH